jgi:hypothetical protein
MWLRDRLFHPFRSGGRSSRWEPVFLDLTYRPLGRVGLAALPGQQDPLALSPLSRVSFLGGQFGSKILDFQTLGGLDRSVTSRTKKTISTKAIQARAGDDRMRRSSHVRNQALDRAMEKSELRRRTPHDMRHTHATLRLSKGDSLAEVSKEMGHSSSEITYKTYYKWLPSESRTDIDELDNTQPSPTSHKKGANHYWLTP